ncbi:hypothetical protein WKW80_34875 [Variovorax humicola]|uniref:Uncharacterized protein n=1 Tax=Variovorax humicola TaxID=1769758 RepID=A0ABU8WAP4_9BURK
MATGYGIITNCTARKRAVGQVARLTPVERTGDPAAIAARWLKTTGRTHQTLTAGELYVGRAMTESHAVASRVRGSLHVVSAGLGLAAREDQVPNYDLTVSQGPGSLAPVLSQQGCNAARWWELLNELKGSPLPLSRLINRTPKTRFLLAMPSAYVAMLAGDLQHIQNSARDRVFIFTSRVGANEVAARLQRCVMPYDERLEGHKDYAGTRADFPQRAMRHFVEEIGGHRLNVESAKAAVERALSRLKKPIIPHRARKSDEEIIELLRTQWSAHEGSSSRLHRYLRDIALVACEQARFGGLWRQLKAELA